MSTELKLEVGCGGRLPGGYIGVDIVQTKAVKGKPFIYGEAAKIPFQSGTVDEVSCCHMVEHLDPRYFVSCLLEWRRVLKVGGALVIQCPNAIVYLEELLEFFRDGGLPRAPRLEPQRYPDEMKNRPYEMWPIIQVTGLASIGDHMVNRNHFSIEHLRFYVEIYGGFEIKEAKVKRTRQSHGIEHRPDGDLIVRGTKR
jgi:predicted SAM-dependent methyltransferase